MALIASPVDFLGVNYYTHRYVRSPGLPPLEPAPGAGDERTGIGWEVYPAGLTEVLQFVASRTGELPLYVTENGAAYDVDPRDPTARSGPGPLPAPPPGGGPRRDRARRAPARLLRLVAAGQLRVGARLRAALRHRPRRLRDAGAADPRQRPLPRVGGPDRQAAGYRGAAGAGRYSGDARSARRAIRRHAGRRRRSGCWAIARARPDSLGGTASRLHRRALAFQPQPDHSAGPAATVEQHLQLGRGALRDRVRRRVPRRRPDPPDEPSRRAQPRRSGVADRPGPDRLPARRRPGDGDPGHLRARLRPPGHLARGPLLRDLVQRLPRTDRSGSATRTTSRRSTSWTTRSCRSTATASCSRAGSAGATRCSAGPATRDTPRSATSSGRRARTWSTGVATGT